MSWPTFFNSLQILSAFLTVLIAFTSGYAAFILWRQRKRHRKAAETYPGLEDFEKNFRYFQESTSERPLALSINLLPNQASAEPDVRAFYREKGGRMPRFLELSLAGINSLPSDLKEFLNGVREKRHEIDAAGATEVHLFYAGPLGTAVYLGAALDNWKLVKIFQRNPTSKKYEYWGTLRK